MTFVRRWFAVPVAALCAIVGGATAQSTQPNGTTPPTKPPSQPQTSPTPPSSATPPATNVAPNGPRPLVRFAPMLYDVKLEVVMTGYPVGTNSAITLRDFAFVMPIVLNGPTSRVDPKSMQPELWFDSRPDRAVSQRARVEATKHLGMSWAIIPLDHFEGTAVRWSVKFRGQSWSVNANENLLAQIAWPREWPADVTDALKPQLGIESDAPVVTALVKQTLGEQARAMPPYYAAKELIRATVTSFRAVNTAATEKRGPGRIVGMRVNGARQSLENRQGSTHDVVCACVAALRAAGIPARPVIGITELSSRDARRSNSDKIQLISWGEFYLPNAGWVPFDTEDLREFAVRQLKTTDPWPGVATIKDLNERMPIAWSFSPEGLAVPAFPALWSMQGSMGLDSNSLDTFVSYIVIPRGKGIDDPQ
ncbi:MAG: transglutaminase-like domain-containing protein [Phycisphaerales bacterium]